MSGMIGYLVYPLVAVEVLIDMIDHSRGLGHSPALNKTIHSL